jgi:hypothetical protein
MYYNIRYLYNRPSAVPIRINRCPGNFEKSGWSLGCYTSVSCEKHHQLYFWKVSVSATALDDCDYSSLWMTMWMHKLYSLAIRIVFQWPILSYLLYPFCPSDHHAVVPIKVALSKTASLSGQEQQFESSPKLSIQKLTNITCMLKR